MFKIIKGQEGFTLLELLAVIIILGALAAIASPMLNKGDKGRIAANNANVTSTSKIAENYDLDKVLVAADYSQIADTHSLVVNGYLKESLKNPWAGVTNDTRQHYRYVLGKLKNGRLAVLLVHTGANPAAALAGTTNVLNASYQFLSTAYYIDETGAQVLIGTTKGI